MDLNITKKAKTQNADENLFILYINIDLLYCIIVVGKLGWDELKSLMLTCKYLHQLITSYDLKTRLYSSDNPGFCTWFTLYKYVREILEEVVLPPLKERMVKHIAKGSTPRVIQCRDVITLYVHNTRVEHFSKGEYIFLGISLACGYEHPNGVPRIFISTQGSSCFDLMLTETPFNIDPTMIDDGVYELNTYDLGYTESPDDEVWGCFERNLKEWYNADGTRI